MLNKNSLAVKKVRPIRSHNGYKRPKTLISSKAKKLNILLRISHLFVLSSFIRWPGDKANMIIVVKMPCKLLYACHSSKRILNKMFNFSALLDIRVFGRL